IPLITRGAGVELRRGAGHFRGRPFTGTLVQGEQVLVHGVASRWGKKPTGVVYPNSSDTNLRQEALHALAALVGVMYPQPVARVRRRIPTIAPWPTTRISPIA